MEKRISLPPQDLEMVQEAVLYMNRRFFDPDDTRLLLEIEDRLDIARRNGGVREEHLARAVLITMEVLARAHRPVLCVNDNLP